MRMAKMKTIGREHGITILIVIAVLAFVFLGKDKLSAWYDDLFKKPSEGGVGGEVEDNSTADNFNGNSDAQALYNAMCDVGTEEQVVLDIFKFRSGAELVEIYEAFGSPRYIPLYGLGTVTGEKTDLFGWIKSEFSGKELEQLKKDWNSKVTQKFI